MTEAQKVIAVRDAGLITDEEMIEEIMALAPAESVFTAFDFDSDEEINGGDVVDYLGQIAEIRRKAEG